MAARIPIAPNSTAEAPRAAEERQGFFPLFTLSASTAPQDKIVRFIFELTGLISDLRIHCRRKEEVCLCRAPKVTTFLITKGLGRKVSVRLFSKRTSRTEFGSSRSQRERLRG